MASSAPIVSQEALRNFRYHYLVTHWGKKVLFMLFNYSFLHGQAKSILEILEENDIRRNKKLLNKDEINSLETKSPKCFDITLMNKIFYYLWQKGVKDPGDELKELVRKIKAERDCVSHEDCSMSDTDLENKLGAFQATLEETLDKTKSLFPDQEDEIYQLKAEINKAVLELLRKIRENYDLSESQDVESLKQEVEDFWSECSELVQKCSREELWSLYKDLCQILPFDQLAQCGFQDPCSFLISLKVEHDRQFNQNYRGIRCTILKQQEIFDTYKTGDDPVVFIISGDAGSGKTTILCSFVDHWYKATADIQQLSDFQTLLYMQFRNRDYNNFEDYLRSLLKETVKRYDFTHVLSYIIGSKCLILCDGYDEVNGNSKKLFEEMLTLKWRDVKIVVTTRPWNTDELTNIVNSGNRSKVNLNVLGLQEREFHLLIEKLTDCLVKDDQENKKVKMELCQKVEEMSYRTKALLKTPKIFTMFIFLYIDSPDLRDELKTKTSIYMHLKKNLNKKIIKETGISEKSMGEFNELYRKWSLKYYIEKKFEWTERDIKNFKEEIRSQISSQDVLQNFRALMSSYFSIKHRYDGLQIVNIYCYAHRSEQEFAIAVDLCDEISVRMQQGGDFPLDAALQSKGLTESSIFHDKDVLKELIGVISFIPGILYQKCPKSDALYNQIKDIQKLYVTYSLSKNTHDEVLEPCIETRLDDQVLQSHVSLLEKTPLKKSMVFLRADGLFVLPPLLSQLKPGRVDFEEIWRDLSKFNEILDVAVTHGIKTRILLWIDLKVSAAFKGEVSHPVDDLMCDIRELIRDLTIAPLLKTVDVYARREEVGYEDFQEYCKTDGVVHLRVFK
ncbi:uncharacterized protein LOC135222051 isoform X2 [Macrobrachium nipponense]|uniref:uncharacterized protein LOC135222051 isoform X2 n=1 Tax=Macrobrachium nipponense TaxID=159736 RepID=UPI0030C86780